MINNINKVHFKQTLPFICVFYVFTNINNKNNNAHFSTLLSFFFACSCLSTTYIFIIIITVFYKIKINYEKKNVHVIHLLAITLPFGGIEQV